MSTFVSLFFLLFLYITNVTLFFFLLYSLPILTPHIFLFFHISSFPSFCWYELPFRSIFYPRALHHFASVTSTVRAFCPGYFSHFVSGLEPRHIGARPKCIPFGLGYHPKSHTQFYALVVSKLVPYTQFHDRKEPPSRCPARVSPAWASNSRS